MTSENDSPNPFQSSEVSGDNIGAQSAPVISDFAHGKRRQLFFILVVMAVSGALHGLLVEDSGWSRVIEVASGLVVAFLTIGWCEIDRKEHQLSRWRFFIPLMAICPGPLIMMPIYFLVTRGLGGLVAIAKASAFLVLMAVVASATFVMTVLFMGAEF